MEPADHIEALRREGNLLATAAERTELDTPIPTCPAWRMRDLVRHIGDVHRWARAHVAEGRLKPIGPKDLPEVAGPLPEDDDLLEWFRQGHARLIRTLETADPATECWTFLPAPSPVAFWARRQAHETGIHRADSQSPGGRAGMTPFPPRFAVDGVDEMLFGFLSRPAGELRADPPRTLHLHATDAEGEWLVRLDEIVQVRPEHAPADCTVRAPASDLHLLLWNRRTPEGLDVEGDRSVLSFWRQAVKVEWSRAR
jgi:uncharacterized protein (TIGR03083 family)